MFKVKFDHVVWANASGSRVTKAGGAELRHAIKLVKNGLAKVKVVDSRYLGPGRSYDTGTSATTYEVTIF
jgi:hypothetical protein